MDTTLQPLAQPSYVINVVNYEGTVLCLSPDDLTPEESVCTGISPMVGFSASGGALYAVASSAPGETIVAVGGSDERVQLFNVITKRT
jgi:hypothetical protein